MANASREQIARFEHLYARYYLKERTALNIKSKFINFISSCTFGIYLFHDKSLDDINNFIKNYKNKINNDLDFIYFLNCIMKFINNGKDSHSICKFKSNKALPFMFKFLNNKIYIVGSNSLYSSYLYKDIISINGISIIKLIKEMRDAISYTTTGHLNSEIEANFSSINGIRYLPIIVNLVASDFVKSLVLLIKKP